MMTKEDDTYCTLNSEWMIKVVKLRIWKVLLNILQHFT